MARDLTKYERMPKKLPCEAGQAWWYAERDHIDIHIDLGGAHTCLKLTRAAIKNYLARTAK